MFLMAVFIAVVFTKVLVVIVLSTALASAVSHVILIVKLVATLWTRSRTIFVVSAVCTARFR